MHAYMMVMARGFYEWEERDPDLVVDALEGKLAQILKPRLQTKGYT